MCFHLLQLKKRYPACYPENKEEKMKLTDRQVKNLKPKAQRYEVWEGGGFGLRIFPTGSKSWIFMYRFNGKVKRATFGNYPKLSVAEAHAAYGKALADLEKGIDVGEKLVAHNRENRDALTVNELIDEYLERWASAKRSGREDKRMLLKDVSPILGHRKAKDIKKKDILNLLDGILQRDAPIAANRTLAVLRRMFNFGIERDIIENTPCAAVKAPAKENRRDRLLSESEIKVFWEGLNGANMFEISKLALKLQLVTAQRKSELISSEWGEFDLKNGWWTIPSTKAKNGCSHLVPLSDLALELLFTLKEITGHSKWLFPSPKGDVHVAPESIDHALRKNLDKLSNEKPYTPHDLRRTAASYMTALGIPRLTVSKLLNHTDNTVTAIYDRHDYQKEKKEAAMLWSKKLRDLINH